MRGEGEGEGEGELTAGGHNICLRVMVMRLVEDTAPA